MNWRARFEALCERKTRAAERAALAAVTTIANQAAVFDLVSIGDAASRRLFDGSFYASPPRPDLPATHLVFVQSRDGNTAAEDPASLGGGATDQHVIYEGLSRVFADAVVAGSATVGSETFFSVWRPELVRLRAALGRPRHPAQIVLSLACTMDPDRYVMFNLPDVPVYVLTNAHGRARLEPRIAERPWVRVIDADGGDALARQAQRLRAAGIRHLSAVGGRRAATALVDAGLVRDLYLTTTALAAGEPDSPWYAGPTKPALTEVLRKQWDGEAGNVTFQHLKISGS